MTALHAAGLAGGLVLLVAGAEALVRGATRLAAAARISPVVVGLTVVAFGTSAPELAVSVGGALGGTPGVAVGNALGSNVFNVLAILGVAAVAGGLAVHQRIVRLDVPLVIAATAAAWLLAADGRLGRVDGLALALGLVGYTVWSYRAARREAPEIVAEYRDALDGDAAPSRPWRAAAFVAVGLAALVAGAQLLVTAATGIAAAVGVSDLVVGLTVVAAGTSLPELATSVLAAARGERDIAVGNVVGSNLFNLTGVLGFAALAAPDGLPVGGNVLAGAFPLTLLAMFVALPALATGLVVDRWEGGVLVLAYLAYVASLVLTGLAHPAAPAVTVGLMAALALLAVGLVAVGLVRRHRPGMR